MNTNDDRNDSDEFFAWLKPRLKKPKTTAVPPPPSEALQKLAWETVQAHHALWREVGIQEEVLMPLAAAEGDEVTRFLRRDCLGGEASYGLLDTGDPDWQILHWTCRREYLPKYQNRLVEIEIGGQTFVLEINREGMAEREIPGGLDLSRAVLRIRDR